MTRSKKGAGQWGISWAEVADVIEEHQVHYSCKLVHAVQRMSYGKSGHGAHWLVSCRAISGRDGAYRQEGYAECSVGGARGASSFPGAFVRSMLDACEDLARRRKDKRYDRDSPVPALE